MTEPTRLAAIIAEASRLSGLTPQALAGRCRTRRFVIVRMAICSVARENGISPIAIGKALGGRGRADIGHHVRRAGVLLGSDVDLAQLVEGLRSLGQGSEAEGLEPVVERPSRNYAVASQRLLDAITAERESLHENRNISC